MNLNRDKDSSGTAIGCLLLLFGGCGILGGLCFFFKMLIDLLSNLKL